MPDCPTMTEIREAIDRLDRALVRLMAERQGHVAQAGRIKAERAAVRDEARIADVLAKVRQAARDHGLDEGLAEAVWRVMVEEFIAFEFRVFDARTDRTPPSQTESAH
jgi:isochorismate pyruvate lyase